MKTDLAHANLAPALLAWYDRHGRHDLPWTRLRTPYAVWVSEVMLQQTQVSTVIGYFDRFMAALPSLPALAAAEEDQVLGLWTGLGYYSRARNLHAAARMCIERHDGALPCDFDALLALPGIGRSTAGAILAQTHGARFPILDGNVKRVLARLVAEPEWPGTPAVEKRLWRLSEQVLPDARIADYTQALMDLGATVCTRAKPRCDACPLQAMCAAHRGGLESVIPKSRPRKAIPQRSAVVLWLRNAQGAHLLQRRPARGVWAALWSLPQFEDAAVAQAWLDAHAGGCVVSRRPLIAHAFTHYKLTIEPWHVHWTRAGDLPPGVPDARWVDATTLATLGVPAPIRTLLENP